MQARGVSPVWALAMAAASAFMGAVLVAALAGAPRPGKALAAGGDLIAMAGAQASRQRFYVVDPGKEVILVYSSTGENSGFKLVATRYYGYDLALGALRVDVPYNDNGYSILQVQRTLEEQQGKTP